MSDDATKPQIPGTLLRGPDGKLYFIPQDKLAPFQVPEKGTQQMEAKLAGTMAATHTSIPADWGLVGLCFVHHP
jgi:hypothetical protein